MYLFERIDNLLSAKGESRNSLAKKMSIAQTTFNGYFNIERQEKIRPLLWDMLIQFPDVSREWLFFGEGEMLKSDEPTVAVATATPTAQPAPSPTPQPQSPAPMPLLGFASCSILGWQGTMTIPVSVEPPKWNEGMIAVMASGESMLPAGIGHGHICYCDPIKTPGVGEAVYVETRNHLGTIKLFCGWSDRGGERYLNLQGWQDRQPEAITQETVTVDVIECDVQRIAPVIYVRRRL